MEMRGEGRGSKLLKESQDLLVRRIKKITIRNEGLFILATISKSVARYLVPSMC